MSKTVLLATAAWSAAAAAAAQESTTRTARDAFGERVGVEAVGLYNEGSVRGFNLQNSAAYRIDGHYFVRQQSISDAALDGVGVRVGANAARLDFPSPSGVVNYRLRDTNGATRWHVGTGLREYETRFLDVGGVLVSEDGEFGLAANFIGRDEMTYALGNQGSIYEYGAVGRWRPSDRLQVRGFVSYTDRAYDGDYGIMAADGALPPTLKPVQSFAPPWAKFISPELTYGVLAESAAGPWSFEGSAFRADWSPQRTDFTLLSTRRDGTAQATQFVTPERKFVSDSFEGRVARVFDGERIDHRLSLSLRGRRSRADTVGGRAFDLGVVNITETPRYGGEPVLTDDGRRVQDEVDQLTASAGWGINVGETLELRLGAHRTRYEKRVTPIGGSETTRAEELWLYNASAVWSLSPRTALFASWLTGLEETGTAPQSATNRNEILPPVEAEQMEFGVTHALTERLSLIGAAFDVSKPTPGFRADGSYGLVGEVRHRGIEASLAGQVRAGTSVVLGAVLIDPKVSGPLVEAGAVGERAPGIPGLTAVASIDHQLSFAPNWSVDANVNHSGERQANTRNTFSTPSHTFLNVGGRYRFRAGPANALLRLQVLNVFDRRGWTGTSSGFLSPTIARRWQATVVFRSRPT